MKYITILLMLFVAIGTTACSSDPESVPTEEISFEAQEQPADDNYESTMDDDLMQQELSKLIQGIDGTIYYLAFDDKRYVFPTDGTFKSWFGNYDHIKSISMEELEKIPIGGNVTYRPGSRLIQTETDFNIYYVDLYSVLRPLEDEDLAEEIYGENWEEYVDDIPNYYFTNYTIGDELTKDNIPEIDPNIVINQILK